ncbi:MAG: cobyrinate a,c-diamide synthase [Gammaproteobacteria bacterium]|nr:cobyrinate a,c-diamide synthase [Gammaproteobacteria bacterium]
MAHLLISAAHKSSGKTTVTLGLCAALHARGLKIQPFKKGPDYIDPMWLGQAAGNPCHNLDFYTMERDEIRATVGYFAAQADLALIEGNKGLYDGLDLDGSNSNAALAKLIQAPVILVIDARGMTRGIAPLILGYQAFDPDIQIAGVILNRLGGSRHESKLRAVIEHYTDVPVIGAVAQDPQLEIVERHLGLIPSNEHAAAVARIRLIGETIGRQVDLDRLQAIAATAPTLPATPPFGAPAHTPAHTPTQVRIGIARDEAFGFYYPDDLAALARAGAELVPIDTLSDAHLPTIDGLFIGGGFPESCMERLAANASLRADIRQAIDNGLPTYAECGGLMYLARSLTWNERHAEMVGIIPGDIVMHERPQGRGYVRLEETADMPWPATADNGAEVAAHEFHYSGLTALAPSARFAFRVLRGTGIDGQHDGYVYKNLLACYTHQRDTQRHRWAQRFVAFVRSRTDSAAHNQA